MKKRQPEIYDSLDMPVYYWQKVHETSDLSWLLKKRGIKIRSKLLKLLQAAWEKIYDEYINEFGVPDVFISIKRKEIYIAEMQLQLILTGDRTLETFIEIEQQELLEMKKAGGKADFMDTKIAIESKFKFQINMMLTSIREFYSYIKHLK